jgi:predicted transcriptional regulator
MLMPEGRRSSIPIIADILKLLRLGKAGKTEITHVLKMSHEMMQRYLIKLLELELIDQVIENRPASYRITKKGLRLLSEIENMQEIINEEETLDILRAPQFFEPIRKHRPARKS